ncbi:MAG: DMT family transporter [Gammaproteobacteria bacterium]
MRSTFLLIAAFVFFWNSGFIGAEVGLDYARPFTLLFWRYWALAGVLAVYLAVRGRLRWPGARRVGLAAVVGVLAHGAWLGCVLLAQDAGVPPGIVALVVALQPMTVGALSGRVVGEPILARQWLGLGLGFAGVLIAVLSRMDFEDSASVSAHLLPFGSVAAITTATLIERRIELRAPALDLPVDQALFWQALATAVVVTGPAVLLEGLEANWTPVFVGTMAWLVIAVSLLAYALMWALLPRLDATRVSSLFYLGPPVTMLMAWLTFGHTLRATDVAGLLVAALGVLFVLRPRTGLRGRAGAGRS